MEITKEQINLLKRLMRKSAKDGNLATAGLVLENGKVIASIDSSVNSGNDATAHSERLLVQKVCEMKKSMYTPGLTMISVVEPCLMCMSACAWAGYKEMAYIIPAQKYIDKIPWMAEITEINKEKIASLFHNPIKFVHLKNLESEFSEVFEKEMSGFLQK